MTTPWTPSPGRRLEPGDLLSVRVRLLPWRPRWRTGETGPEVPDLGLGDDPVSAVIGLVLLLLFLPAVLLALVGVVVLGLELLALLALLPFALTAQVLGLRPWVLVLRTRDRRRSTVEVPGTRAMLARRRQLRAQRVA